MDEFYSYAWDNMPTLVGYVGLYFAVTLGLDAALNYRAGRKLFSRATIAGQFQNMLWFLALFAMIFLPDVFERHGLPSWLGFAVPALMLFTLPMLFIPNQKKLRSTAIPNPHANAKIDITAAEKFTTEESRVNLKLNALLLAFAVSVVGAICYFSFVMPPRSTAGLVALLAFVASMAGILTYAIVGRHPGTIEVVPSSIVIDRPLAEIWETVRFRNTTDWWKKIVSRVEKLDQPGEHYKLHYYNDDTCGQCGLPRNPDGGGRANIVEILEIKDMQFMRTRARPMGKKSVVGMLDYEEESLEFLALDANSTRVTSRSLVSKPKVWLAMVLKLGDPLGEELRTLKAHMEGTTAGTLFEAGAARVAAHRHAENFCGCADGTPVANKFVT